MVLNYKRNSNVKLLLGVAPTPLGMRSNTVGPKAVILQDVLRSPGRSCLLYKPMMTIMRYVQFISF
jgi:hypothetical protein